MQYFIITAFLVAGLANFVPVIGLQSAERLEGMYAVEISSPGLVVLMRHRAVLFGILGTFMIASAFIPAWQIVAAAMGLVSMLAFVALDWQTAGSGEIIHKAAMIDLAASALLAAALAALLLGYGERQ